MKRAARAGNEGAYYSDAEVTDTYVRILTTPIGEGYVLQIARPLAEVNTCLYGLRRILILVVARRYRSGGRRSDCWWREPLSHRCAG